jgi:hypothetical protein
MDDLFSLDKPRETEYSGFECPVCRELIGYPYQCGCDELDNPIEDHEHDWDDAYDMDSALESVYGPSENYYDEY